MLVPAVLSQGQGGHQTPRGRNRENKTENTNMLMDSSEKEIPTVDCFRDKPRSPRLHSATRPSVKGISGHREGSAKQGS